MVKDTINSVFDNLKERTTNPFLGTLIVVWILKNWKLVYSLFYFDSNFKLKDRLLFINQYFNEKSFLMNMVLVIVYTLIVLLITYILLGLSRLLTDYYDKVVVPLISKFTDTSTVVLKTDYNKLFEEVKRLESRLEEERSVRIAAQNERDTAFNKMAKLQEVEAIEGDTNANTNTFKRVYNNLREYSSIAEINSIIQNIQDKKPNDPNNIAIRALLQEDFINRDPRTVSEGRYILTDEGKKFIRHWNDNS